MLNLRHVSLTIETNRLRQAIVSEDDLRPFKTLQRRTNGLYSKEMTNYQIFFLFLRKIHMKSDISIIFNYDLMKQADL